MHDALKKHERTLIVADFGLFDSVVERCINFKKTDLGLKLLICTGLSPFLQFNIADSRRMEQVLLHDAAVIAEQFSSLFGHFLS